MSSNQDNDEVKLLREELKNKSTIINILYENIFSDDKHFASNKRLEDIIKQTLKKINLNLPKDLNNRSERIIIHCRTNDLKNTTPQSITDDISSLAKSVQQENNIVHRSIAPSKDHLYKKDKEFKILGRKYSEMNLK